MYGCNSSCTSAGVFAVGRWVTFDAETFYQLDNGRARAFCACSRCGWELLGYIFLSPIISLFFIPLSGMDGWVTCDSTEF